jgi:hypothetical protein
MSKSCGPGKRSEAVHGACIALFQHRAAAEQAA